MNNKKAFTLVELLAVLVLIILVMLLIVPNLNNLMNKNNEKIYVSYEDMMVEYTKIYPQYEDYNYICLEDLGLDRINKKINCNGFVKINDSNIAPYLYCTNKKSEELYKTKDYDIETPVCFGEIDKNLSLVSTINDSNIMYNSGTWINGKNFVNLKFKTLGNMEMINVESEGKEPLDCELINENNYYTCNVSVFESGIYKSYGVLDGENIYANEINVLFDKTPPSFDIYNNDSITLENSNIVMEIGNKNINFDNIAQKLISGDNQLATIDINTVVKNINDSESGVKSIRYSFEKETDNLNFINVSLADSFNISKTLELGNYKLVVEVTDNVDNKTEKIVNYQINLKAPDKVLYTVIHKKMANDGVSYVVTSENSFSGEIGAVVKPEVNTYDNFISPTPQELTLTDNPDNNIITYLYERTCFGNTCDECTKGSYLGTCMYNNKDDFGLWNSGLEKDKTNQNLRFTGTKSNEPNNWVCFGTKSDCTNTNNLYRIIGVFSPEHRVRLIIGKRLGPKPWKNSSYSGSTLMKYTHSDIVDDVDAILTSSKYGYKTLINDTKKWSDIIVSTKRDSFADDDNALPKYSANKFLIRDYRDGARSYSAKLHLTSTADLLLSTGSTSVTFASNPSTVKKSWMYAGAEWTYQIYNTGYVYVINTVGRICGNGTSKCSILADLTKSNDHMYRITFDLHKNTLFCGGSGTNTDPIILGYGACTN